MKKDTKCYDILIAKNPVTKEERYFFSGLALCKGLGIPQSTWYNKSKSDDEVRFLRGWVITKSILET